MKLAQATARIRCIIRETLAEECGSRFVTGMMSGLFYQQINESIRRLREEFKLAKERGVEDVIWPKMMMNYAPDTEGAEVYPVWGPIRDADGKTLGIKVFSQTQGGVSRKQRAHLHWYPPEPE